MIVIDCEYIPENSPMGDVPGPRPNVEEVYCEVIQIGVCKLDDQGREKGWLSLTVKPCKIETIPPWLSRMTGISNSDRARGVSFLKALGDLLEFVGGDHDIWTFNGDWYVLMGNAYKQAIWYPFQEPFKRFKPYLPEFGITEEDFAKAGFSEVCSSGLHKVLGIEIPPIEGIGPHNAVYDARSLAYSIHHLLKKTGP